MHDVSWTVPYLVFVYQVYPLSPEEEYHRLIEAHKAHADKSLWPPWEYLSLSEKR